MSLLQSDLAIVSPPLSTSDSRPASSAASTYCGEQQRPASATPWDSIIEEELLRDLNLASQLQQQQQQQRMKSGDLAQRLTRQYLQERQEQQTIHLLLNRPKKMKRKNCTPHRIVKSGSSAAAATHTAALLVSDPLSNLQAGLDNGRSSENCAQSRGVLTGCSANSQGTQIEQVVSRLKKHRQCSVELSAC